MIRNWLVGSAVSLAFFLIYPVSASDQQTSASIERGRYLVSILDCGYCHSGGALLQRPDPARFLAGSEVGFLSPGLGVFWPPNLTPDDETGLGTWSVEEIARAVRTGERPNGRGLAPVMPWQSYAALTEDDARALATYLKSLPPVRYTVPDPVGEGQDAPAPYLGRRPFVAPSR